MVKISQEPSYTTPIDNDVLLINDVTNNVTKKTTRSQLLTASPQQSGSYYNPTVSGMRSWDGWQDANDTFSFLSATTITVSVGAVAKYPIGSKLKLVQSGATKYFYIVSVTNTALTVTGGSDYSVANAAISGAAFSLEETPLNFPHWFNFTPSYTGFSSAPTGGNHRFCIKGRSVFVNIFPNASGTSNATTMTLALPVTAANSVPYAADGLVRITDNGTVSATLGMWEISGAAQTSVSFFKDNLGGGWTATGTKLVKGQMVYEI